MVYNGSRGRPRSCTSGNGTSKPQAPWGATIDPDFDGILVEQERLDAILAIVHEIVRSSGASEHLAPTARLAEQLLQAGLSTEAQSPLDHEVQMPSTAEVTALAGGPSFPPPSTDVAVWRVLGADVWRDGGSYSATLQQAQGVFSLWLQVLPWDRPADVQYGALYASAGPDPTLMQHLLSPTDETAWMAVLSGALLSEPPVADCRSICEEFLAILGSRRATQRRVASDGRGAPLPGTAAECRHAARTLERLDARNDVDMTGLETPSRARGQRPRGRSRRPSKVGPT